MITEDNIREDLMANDYGEEEITNAVKRVRYLHKKLSLPYFELVRSKFDNTLKYILIEVNDRKGSILITNLDTGKTYTFSDEPDYSTDVGEELRRSGGGENTLYRATKAKWISGLLGRRGIG